LPLVLCCHRHRASLSRLQYQEWLQTLNCFHQSGLLTPPVLRLNSHALKLLTLKHPTSIHLSLIKLNFKPYLWEPLLNSKYWWDFRKTLSWLPQTASVCCQDRWISSFLLDQFKHSQLSRAGWVKTFSKEA
jgi:hypothetical protein